MSRFNLPGLGSQVVRHATGSQAASLDLEFVFLPLADEAADGRPGPKLKGHKKHPKQWRNSNREGSALSFWRKVKDELRYLTFHSKRGGYIAHGPHGRHNNIEPGPLFGGAGQPPPRHPGEVAHQDPPQPDSTAATYGDCIDPLALSQPQLQVPPLPPLPPRLFHKPAKFLGQEVTSDKPIKFSREVLFVEGTADFINRVAARQVMQQLLNLMLQYPSIEVTIIGNAANDWEQKGYGLPYGTNKARLNSAPMYGYFDGKPYFGSPYRTTGALMLARARAIASLLTSQGISAVRVHCDIGRFGFGSIKVPGSAKPLRRATIVISDPSAR